MKITKWFWIAAVVVILIASQQEVRITGEPLPAQTPLLILAGLLSIAPFGIGILKAVLHSLFH